VETLITKERRLKILSRWFWLANSLTFTLGIIIMATANVAVIFSAAFFLGSSTTLNILLNWERHKG
jgi:hypothetical protein